jgi:uncharacterized protein YdaL
MAERVKVWTKTALKQRREILKYWKLKNKTSTYFEKIIRLTQHRILVIAENPFTFKLTSSFDIRESIMGNFSLYYK